MQSGYGGVSEMQQFLVDGCGTTLFSISPPPPPPTNPTVTTDIHTTPTQPGLKYHPFHHPHHLHPHPHHHPHHQPPPPAPPHFSHFHPIPITQQLFQQSHHQFQLFHPQSHEERRSIPVPHHHHHQHHHQDHHPGLDPESGPENSTSPTRMMVGAAGGGDRERGPPPPPFLAPAMNFKLAVNESSGGGSGEGMNDEEGILQGDDGSESRFHPWQREEESAIKEPFWRPLDIDYINRNNKRCKDKEPESSTNTYCKKSKDGSEAGQENPTTGSNYKLFSELEAIYKPGGGGNYQTGSGSALTGDENPLVAAMPPGPAGDPRDAAAGSDTSTHGGGETPVAASKLPKGGGSGGRRKRKRRQQQQMSSIAVFFEGLVKQLMDHQEVLHRKFLEVMERRDQERTGREEAWRRQEAAKSAREAAARAEERALSATREAAIISFLEKVTGESLDLPTKSQFQSQLLDETQKEDNTDVNIPWETSDPLTTTTITTTTTTINNNSDNRVQLNTSRWPRTEVQALIRVRSALEMRFQEPGLKGPLWEEVSSMMGSMGYQRSSKRCKEKWENINKYFRKTKDSGKKRPQHSKTCPYFQQLDQLYSSTKSLTKANAAPNPMERRDNSELLDAIVVSTDHPTNFNSVPLRIDFNGKEGDKTEPSESAMAAKESDDNDNDDDDDEGGYEEAGEGEGESQGQWQEQQQHLQNLHT